MNRVNTPVLTEKQRKELENGSKNGTTRCFRVRCRVILLKAECRSSKEVGEMINMCEGIVNSLVKKYQAGGIAALRTRPGQGRKPVITDEDKEIILAAMKANGQQMKAAKAEWEKKSGKTVCNNTFKSFLRKIAVTDDGFSEALKTSEQSATTSEKL
jgi:transposase